MGRVLGAEPGPPCPFERAGDGGLGHVVEGLGHDNGIDNYQQDRDLSFIFHIISLQQVVGERVRGALTTPVLMSHSGRPLWAPRGLLVR